jgi:hypothetical protein
VDSKNDLFVGNSFSAKSNIGATYVYDDPRSSASYFNNRFNPIAGGGSAPFTFSSRDVAENNPGLNFKGFSIIQPTPASSAVNSFPYPVYVYLTNGTFTSVTISGTVVWSSSTPATPSGSFFLLPDATISLSNATDFTCSWYGT